MSSATSASARAPTADELDTWTDGRDDLPWVALCWIESNAGGDPAICWSLDRQAAPSCARPHLLGGRRALPRRATSQTRR